LDKSTAIRDTQSQCQASEQGKRAKQAGIIGQARGRDGRVVGGVLNYVKWEPLGGVFFARDLSRVDDGSMMKKNGV